ncbi:MAG: glycosyl transferase family 2 [Fluviicola sp. XM-24bin1]|nr:MAG: glycosyl transferase family 2 [Fluviicola sp. XM-24bin1]
MKISILLPFRNAAPWMEETIQSILNQSHEDWELIAVDDHSEDNTVALIERFDDSRIQLFENAGEGIIPALQTALDQASGAFITRMDADDLMPPNKLEVLLQNMQGGRTVVTGKVKYFSESEVSEGYRTYENWLNERIYKKDHFQHIYRECVIASPCWLVSAQLIREDRIFDQLQYPEDYDMTFLWRKYGYQIVPVNEITHLWREHPARTSRNSDIYDQASFFQLKLDWFRKSERGRTLGVFGAGPKGKLVVEQLKKHFEIHWFDHEFENYQAPIHGFEIQNPETCTCNLLLLAVFPQNKTRLEDLVTRLGYTFGTTVWYV